MQGACYWWLDLIHMNYILPYNYCNLDKVQYSGTDITSISDNVLSEAGIYTLWFLKEQVKVEMWKVSANKLIALYSTHYRQH